MGNTRGPLKDADLEWIQACIFRSIARKLVSSAGGLWRIELIFLAGAGRTDDYSRGDDILEYGRKQFNEFKKFFPESTWTFETYYQNIFPESEDGSPLTPDIG